MWGCSHTGVSALACMPLCTHFWVRVDVSVGEQVCAQGCLQESTIQVRYGTRGFM